MKTSRTLLRLQAAISPFGHYKLTEVERVTAVLLTMMALLELLYLVPTVENVIPPRNLKIKQNQLDTMIFVLL